MASSTDAQEYLRILDTLEEEYRSDLGIHLYSTFLLHRLNYIFPRRNWSSWPLPKDEVPDASSAKRYEDIIVDDTFKANSGHSMLTGSDNGPVENTTDLHSSSTNGTNPSKNVKMLYDETQVAPEDLETSPTRPLTQNVLESDESDLEFGLQSSFQEMLSDNESDTETHTDTVPADTVKVVSVATKEKMANPKASLMNEIGVLIEKKIHERLLKQNALVEVSTDIYKSPVAKELTKRLANKTSKLVGGLIRQSEELVARQTEARQRQHRQLFSWHDIILANLENEAGPELHANTHSLEEVLRKCEKLFVNVKYKYEFDVGHDSGEQSDDDDESSDEDSGNQTGPFDHAHYLQTFVERFRHPLKSKLGNKFGDLILAQQKRDQFRYEMVKTIYLQRLRVEKRLRDLSWDIPRKKRLIFKNKEPMVHGTHLQMKRAQALHGGLGITADEFLANV